MGIEGAGMNNVNDKGSAHRRNDYECAVLCIIHNVKVTPLRIRNNHTPCGTRLYWALVPLFSVSRMPKGGALKGCKSIID